MDFRVFETGVAMAVDVPLHGNLEFHKEKDIIKQHKRLLFFYGPSVKI